MLLRFAPFLLLLLGLPATAAPVPKGNADGTLLVVTSDGVLRLLTPDGKELKKLDPKDGDGRPVFARLSPDGKRVVLVYRADDNSQATTLRVRDLVTGERTDLAELPHASRVIWSPDGATVYASGFDIDAGKGPNHNEGVAWASYAIVAKTGKVKRLDLDGEYQTTGVTADGKHLVSLRLFRPPADGKRQKPPPPQLETYLTDPTTLKHELLVPADTKVSPLAAFPDSKRWLVQMEDDGTKPWVRVYDADEKKLVEMPGWSDDGVLNNTLRVSPDGKRLAFVRVVTAAKRWELVVAGVAGKEANVVYAVTRPEVIRAIDWR